MSSTDTSFASFRSKASRARTLLDLGLTYGAFVGSLGFTAYAVGFVPGQPGLSGDPFLFINWPRAWLELYAREGFAADDAVVAAASTAVEPFTWAELQQRQPGASERIFAAARRFDWNDGLLIPIRLDVAGEQRLGVASLAAPSLSDLTAEGRSTLAAASTYAFEAGLRLRHASPRPTLSKRETQALALVAAGFGDREIAERMGIMPATAHSYVEQAKRKLGATSRAQAVAFAIGRGFLTV